MFNPHYSLTSSELEKLKSKLFLNVSASVLTNALAWIQINLLPEQVFDEHVLADWARRNEKDKINKDAKGGTIMDQGKLIAELKEIQDICTTVGHERSIKMLGSLIARVQMGDPEPQHPPEKCVDIFVDEAALFDIHKFICRAETYFMLRDETNSMLHLDSVRYSEITKAATSAKHALDIMLGFFPPKGDD